MNLCITAYGAELTSKIDPRFGRAEYYIFYDTDTDDFRAHQNVESNTMHGAGIQAGQLMSSNNVQAVVTGQVGPNAFQTLQAAGIKIYHAGDMTVAEAIEDFKNDKLPLTTDMGPAHSGLRNR
ncbi:NifB/NifX family molybdenum-iron cluster-binding protein [candidate division KSB1 bacterium]|nr:NifB/NifX family molybdenum-iron cluster-binding protein [candidate division KSB1 bacterium]